MTEMNQTDSYPEGTSGLESKEQDINSQTTRQPRLENTGQKVKLSPGISGKLPGGGGL